MTVKVLYRWQGKAVELFLTYVERVLNKKKGIDLLESLNIEVIFPCNKQQIDFILCLNHM